MFSNLVIAIPVAAIMTLVAFYLIWRIKSGTGIYFTLYITGMMLLMNALAVSIMSNFLVFPMIVVNAAFMSLGAIPLLQGKNIAGRKYVLVFAILMSLSEFFMGGFLNAIQTGSTLNLLSWINNPWFTSVMGAEMLFSVSVSIRKEGSWSTASTFALALTLIMIASPTTFPHNQSFFTVSVWTSSIIMILSTVLVYESLYRQKLRKTQDTTLSLEIMLIFLSMMTGLFLVFIVSSWILISLTMVAGMIWVIYRTCSEKTSNNTNYLRNRNWAFLFILITFVMEWFMGAALDFISGEFGTGLSGFIDSMSLPWISSGIVAPFWDAANVILTVTGSVWFLIMMGTEMGILAVSKITVTKQRENRVRLALMITAYALYTIYIPAFSPLASKVQFIPYMWSMGIGTLGPASTSVIIPGIIGTYAVSASLSFMFGSRQICSVTCMAPLMYQGTFYDSLKTYNRSSALGRKTLTSRIRPWFSFIVIAVSIFILVSAVISYMNTAGIISFSIMGVDISVLAYTVWFNLLWYIVFVSIPFMGTYACVTQGWCYWGTFNQFMSRIGLFRLKVKSSNTCLTCKTVDCASACPVGLTDMRKPFIDKGYFRAYKCVGVGDCVEACPYDNIFFYDVRHFLREKLSFRGKQEK